MIGYFLIWIDIASLPSVTFKDALKRVHLLYGVCMNQVSKSKKNNFQKNQTKLMRKIIINVKNVFLNKLFTFFAV